MKQQVKQIQCYVLRLILLATNQYGIINIVNRESFGLLMKERQTSKETRSKVTPTSVSLFDEVFENKRHLM